MAVGDAVYCPECFTPFPVDPDKYDLNDPEEKRKYDAEVTAREQRASRAKAYRNRTVPNRTAPVKVTTTQRQPMSATKPLAICLCVLAVLFVLAIGITTGNQNSGYYSSRSSGRSSYGISDDMKGALWSLAQKAVKNELKAPSTAKFPASYGSDGVSFGKSGDLYYVKGWVDAQNSFGTMLRVNFTVYADFDGTKVTLDHVYLDE